MPDGRENDAQQAAAAARQNGANFFNPFAVELPEKFDFRDPNDWKRWVASLQMKIARNSEIIKKQQNELRDGTEHGATVEELRRPKERRNHGGAQRKPAKPPAVHFARNLCKWCGSTQQHSKKQWPAFEKLCNNCGKTGHYATVCLSGRQQPTGQRASGSSTRKLGTANTEEVFLGEVSEADSLKPWFIIALVNSRPVRFKVDTGADVSVIPASQYDSSRML
ncbi:hypothetical protein MTO96_051163 [Rhipicephalus appendiculatus]